METNPQVAPTSTLRSVFVLMPFETDGKRSSNDLTIYYQQLKEAIETAPLLQHKYTVRRAGTSLNITQDIIHDIFFAHIVIADLSGDPPNPNVMYELGVRLASSHQPVILVRADNAGDTFDVRNYKTFAYNPLRYPELFAHIIDQLRRLEEGAIEFRSPVLDAVENALPVQFAESHAYAMRQLSVFSQGLYTLWEHLSTMLAAWLGEREIEPRFYPDAERLVEFLFKSEDIPPKEWDSFTYDVSLLPGIYDLVAARYLFGLVEAEVEEALWSIAYRYYMFYVFNEGSTAFWPTKRLWLANLLQDSAAVNQMVQGVQALMSAETAEARERIKDEILTLQKHLWEEWGYGEAESRASSGRDPKAEEES